MAPLGRGVLPALLFLGVLAGAQAPPAAASLDAPWAEEAAYQGAALRPAPDGAGIDVARFDHYRLTWDLDAASGVLHGRMALQFENRSTEPQQALRLQRLPELLGASLEVTAARVGGDEVAVRPRDDWWLQLPLPTPLAPGQRALARVDYRVEVPHGEGAQGFDLLARDDGLWSLAHAYPVRLPQDRPPTRPSLAGDVLAAEAATFRLRLRLPPGWAVSASGSTFAPPPEGAGAPAGSVVREVVTGPVRDLYVQLHEPGAVAVMTEEGPVTLLGHARDGEAAGMRAAMADAEVALAAMETTYGHYPYRELDLAPLDTPALGVEFPGMVLLSSDLLRGGAGATLRSTVVHEVAHQWFYGLVGSDQVRTPWVDEGVTQYVTLRLLGTHFGEDVAARFRRTLVNNWRSVEFAPLAFDRPVAAFSSGTYVPIVYGRVPLLLEAAAERIGAERFDGLLRAWVADHRFARSDGAELRARIEAACDCVLEALQPDVGGAARGARLPPWPPGLQASSPRSEANGITARR